MKKDSQLCDHQERPPHWAFEHRQSTKTFHPSEVSGEGTRTVLPRVPTGTIHLQGQILHGNRGEQAGPQGHSHQGVSRKAVHHIRQRPTVSVSRYVRWKSQRTSPRTSKSPSHARPWKKWSVSADVPTGNITVTIQHDKGQVRFKNEATTIVSQILQGEFPNYEQLIPSEYNTKLSIDKKQFAQGINAAAALTRNDNSIARFLVTTGVAPSMGQKLTTKTPTSREDNEGVEAGDDATLTKPTTAKMSTTRADADNESADDEDGDEDGNPSRQRKTTTTAGDETSDESDDDQADDDEADDNESGRPSW